MESHDSHVTEDDLERFDAGTLTEDERDRVAAHVQECEECNDRHAGDLTRRDGPPENMRAPRPRME